MPIQLLIPRNCICTGNWLHYRENKKYGFSCIPYLQPHNYQDLHPTCMKPSGKFSHSTNLSRDTKKVQIMDGFVVVFTLSIRVQNMGHLPYSRVGHRRLVWPIAVFVNSMGSKWMRACFCQIWLSSIEFCGHHELFSYFVSF